VVDIPRPRSFSFGRVAGVFFPRDASHPLAAGSYPACPRVGPVGGSSLPSLSGARRSRDGVPAARVRTQRRPSDMLCSCTRPPSVANGRGAGFSGRRDDGKGPARVSKI
jgi:hypothetical protein